MIVAIIVVLQIILVTFTGMAFGVYANYGLTIEQWGISIFIGSWALVINLILKLLPIARHDHQHPSFGYGNKVVDIRH